MTDTTETRPAGADDEARLALLRRRLSERGLSAQQTTGAASEDRLSDGQLRMWFVHQADPSGALLNICLSYRISGPVDLAALRGALDAVARRHPVLRTTYAADENGEPRPTVHAELRPGWTEHDLTDLADQSEQARRLRLEVLAQREFTAPFDLSVDSPLRITMIRTGADEHIMLLVAHHIAWDDGSWEVFFDDLTRAYTGVDLGEELAPQLPPGPRDPDADLAYWREVLADPPEPLELPGPHGSAVPSGWRSARDSVTLGADTARRVVELAQETGCTPYAVLLAVFGTLIFRYTHADDFLVATPVLNRDSGAEQRVGYYGNTVAMRLRPNAAMSFRDMLAQSRDTALGAFAHQGINLDRVVRELNPDRRHGTERMTRVSFGFRGPDRFGFTPPGVRCERAELRSRLTQLPLGVMIEFDPDPADPGATVEIEHLVEVIEPALGRQLLRHFVVLLEDALRRPDTPLSRLRLMDDADLAWLRDVSRGDRFDTPARTLPDLIESQVRQTPDAVAVVYEGRHYSYRELNEAANRVAHWLIGQGIGTEDRVAVLLDKSPELVITALGVLKAGAVYLPIDPTYPDDRLSFILGDCDARLVLREPVSDLDGQPTTDPTDTDRVRPLLPGNTAYLIYTSGTTGLPKGVPVPHRPVAEYFVWFKGDYQVDANDRLLQVASPSFDVSIAEIFGTLACGARLVIHRPGGLNDIGYLTALLQDEGITAMHFVPSLLGLFLSLPGVNQWRTLQRVPIGGEPLPGEVADKFHATFDALLHNFYGPTETVINASRYKVEGKQGTRIVPIGRPKINTQLHLLDNALQPVPVGVIGEIYIGGTHVAHGYHRRPGLTAERFVADPFNPGGRLYRSGDLARRNADGDIEFVGRADEQVKIRGFRIELGDVAAAISVDPSVGQAVVVATDLPNVGRSLVGYLTPVSGESTDSVAVERIRARVAAALPEYMVPAAYVVLDEIPITTHGKIDRAALPEPQIASMIEYREPATDTEREVARLFGDLLGRSGRIGADDSFFDLGGHSLLATKLVAAVRSAFGVDIGVQDVFELGTVARLAGRIDELRSGSGGPLRPRLTPQHFDGPAPLSSSQLRSWFAYRVDGPSVVNNIPFAARLHGPVDVDALEAAIGDVIARHEILRTVYREIDGVPYQIVLPTEPVPVRRADGQGEQWLRAELDAERRHVFDLENERPIRPAILSLRPDAGSPDSPAGDVHVLSLVMHHIAGDHWSATVLFTDLLTAYRARTAGQEPAWAPLPVQYADFGAWESELLAEETGIAGPQREYWTRQLAGLPEETGLRPDFPRPPVPSGLAEAVEFTIDAAVREKLAGLCRDLGITEFMALQAAVAVVLHKAGSGSDIPLGTPVAGRSEPELDQLVGFFINILVLRNDLSGNPSLREVCRRAREMALAAYAHQDLPFDQVVDAVSPVRTLARNPLFSVVVHVREQLPENRVIDHGPDGDTTVTVLEPPFDAAHADLSLNFFAAEDGGGYRGHVIYRPELYSRDTAQRFADWLGRVVTAFAERPDITLRELEIGAPGERRRILEEWGGGTVYVLDETLQPVPVGVVGDVYTAGPALAAAHWTRAGVTATRLVADPVGNRPGARLYRTGDRARWTADGVLEFVDAQPPTIPAVRPDSGQRPGGPPATDTERALATLLAEVLDTEVTGRDDDFFSLGGDSILAVQLAARARDTGLKLTARMVFEHPTLHELAAAVEAREAIEARETAEAGGAEAGGAESGGGADGAERGAAAGDSGNGAASHAPMSTSGLSAEQLSALTASWNPAGEDAP